MGATGKGRKKKKSKRRRGKSGERVNSRKANYRQSTG
jgi:hypothetical protein